MTTQVEGEHKATVFKYEAPPIDPKRGKGHGSGCRTELLGVSFQTVREGGETNLHAHPGIDGVWFVLAGRARFYEDVETVTAELGAHEGILIPHGVKYWFESASDEPLEIMHITGRYPNAKRERINYTPTLPQQEARGINAF